MQIVRARNRVVKKVNPDTGEMTNLTPDEAVEAKLMGYYCPCLDDILLSEGDILPLSEEEVKLETT